MKIQIQISPGELYDRITILQIKKDNIRDFDKQVNIQKELQLLNEVRANITVVEGLESLVSELLETNKLIWDAENTLRADWNNDDVFLVEARKSHFLNDKRANLKKMINHLLGSAIIEEKSHPAYEYKE